MEFVSWILVGIGVYVLIASIYRLSVSLRALSKHTAITQAALTGFEIEDAAFKKASPTSEQELPKLLRDQRHRRAAKEQARLDRQRRLIDRISSIKIDKRSA
jgi:hypothetical protein